MDLTNTEHNLKPNAEKKSVQKSGSKTEKFLNMTFSVSQLAELFGVSRTIIYELVREGQITGTSVPHGKGEKVIFNWNDHKILTDRFMHRIKKPEHFKVKMFGNLKGGQGKSTLAAQYAMRASAQGLKTLIIDLDPQGHATQFLGFKGKEAQELPTIRDALIKDSTGKYLPLTKIIIPVTPLLSLIPSNLNLSTLDIELVPQTNREQKIPKLIEGIKNQYDLIIFDSSPAASLTNISAILASDELCVVCSTDHTAVTGINKIFTIIASLEEEGNLNTPMVRIIPNLYDIREKMAQECLGFLRTSYSDITTATVVRKNQDLKEAQKLCQAIWQYNPKATGSEDITALTNELISEAHLTDGVSQ